MKRFVALGREAYCSPARKQIKLFLRVSRAADCESRQMDFWPRMKRGKNRPDVSCQGAKTFLASCSAVGWVRRNSE